MLGWNQSMWLAFLLGAALKSTVVVGAAWLLAFALRRRSAAARHLVWTAAAVALLALPLLSVSMPALPVRSQMLAPLVSGVTFRVTASGSAAPAVSLSKSTPQHPSAAQPASPAPAPSDFRLSIAFLWAAGSTLVLAHMLAAWMVMWQLRRTARPVADRATFDALARSLGIGRKVALLEVPRGAMPLSFGILRPAVFLPADARAWGDGRRRVVMLHELAHICRCDLAMQMVGRAAVALFWWNPLAWMAWREFVKERERAADDLVLAAGEPATEYASHLLEIARSMQRVPALASAAVAMARPSQLEGRLVAILDSRIHRNSIGPRSAVAAAVLAVALVAPFAALRAQDKPETAQRPAVGAIVSAVLDQQIQSATEKQIKAAKDEVAQQMLQTSLANTAKTAGEQSSAYAAGLMKLGDLAAKRGQSADAVDYYSKAAALGDTPETARGLVYLASYALGQKNLIEAQQFIDRALNAVPTGPLASRALTIKGNIAMANGLAGVAELNYLQALAQAEPGTPDAALTMETYARLLVNQARLGEADAMLKQALTIRQADVSAILASAARDSGDAVMSGAVFAVGRPPAIAPQPQDASEPAMRVGSGVSAPVLLSKTEPDYSEEARVAKFQGTAVLHVVIGTDGRATTIGLVKSLGFGLDEKAAEAVAKWKFKPGMKNGVPVPVDCTVEVNFRLL